MASCLKHSEQAISAKVLRRNLRAMLQKVAHRSIDNLVVTKKSKPVAVILNVDAYEELLEQLEILRLEALAGDRLLNLNHDSLLSFAEMRSRFAIDS